MKNQYMNQLLGEYETVLLSTRQHPFVLVSSILLELLLISIISTIVIIIALSQSTPLLWAALIIALIPLGGIVRDVLVWTNRQYIVTNRRVIQIAGVINKTVTDSSLEKVNDVKMIQSFWGRLFNFGDVEILTASEMGINRFKRIGNPVRFKTAMLNAKEAMANDNDFGIGTRKSNEPSLNDIPRLIADLDDLRTKGIITQEEFELKKGNLLDKI